VHNFVIVLVLSAAPFQSQFANLSLHVSGLWYAYCLFIKNTCNKVSDGLGSVPGSAHGKGPQRVNISMENSTGVTLQQWNNLAQ